MLKIDEWFEFRRRLVLACERVFPIYANIAQREGMVIIGDIHSYYVEDFEMDPPVVIMTTFCYQETQYCRMPLSLVLDKDGDVMDSSYNFVAMEEFKHSFIAELTRKRQIEEECRKIELDQQEYREKEQLKLLIKKYGVPQ